MEFADNHPRPSDGHLRNSLKRDTTSGRVGVNSSRNVHASPQAHGFASHKATARAGCTLTIYHRGNAMISRARISH